MPTPFSADNSNRNGAQVRQMKIVDIDSINPDAAYTGGNANASTSSDGTATTAAGAGAGMTWAQALNDARTLIVRQSARIKSDAQAIKAQQDEIAQLRAALEATAAEVQRLRSLEPQLTDALARREHAEAVVGRQQVEIDSLETASRELQRMLGEQAGRITEMTTELQRLRSSVPTDEDAAALESMAALLTTARAGARGRQTARPQRAQGEHAPHPLPLSGPALARQQREARDREVRERELREQIQREPVEIAIPADPTPFCAIATRQAA
jgi:DNA repair exonuclease SbcCD ATPase subunit